jgi:hypothetical protein
MQLSRFISAPARRGTALVLAILLATVLTAIVMCLAMSANIQSNTTASYA